MSCICAVSWKPPVSNCSVSPSAIVPALLGDTALSRLLTRYTQEAGAVVNLVEYPAVSRNNSRWRLQTMARHEPHHIDRLVEIAIQARTTAKAHIAALAQSAIQSSEAA